MRSSPCASWCASTSTPRRPSCISNGTGASGSSSTATRSFAPRASSRRPTASRPPRRGRASPRARRGRSCRTTLHLAAGTHRRYVPRHEDDLHGVSPQVQRRAQGHADLLAEVPEGPPPGSPREGPRRALPARSGGGRRARRSRRKRRAKAERPGTSSRRTAGSAPCGASTTCSRPRTSSPKNQNAYPRSRPSWRTPARPGVIPWDASRTAPGPSPSRRPGRAPGTRRPHCAPNTARTCWDTQAAPGGADRREGGRDRTAGAEVAQVAGPIVALHGDGSVRHPPRDARTVSRPPSSSYLGDHDPDGLRMAREPPGAPAGFRRFGEFRSIASDQAQAAQFGILAAAVEPKTAERRTRLGPVLGASTATRRGSLTGSPGRVDRRSASAPSRPRVDQAAWKTRDGAGRDRPRPPLARRRLAPHMAQPCATTRDPFSPTPACAPRMAEIRMNIGFHAKKG